MKQPAGGFNVAEIIQAATAAERERCISLFVACRDAACVKQFLKLVRDGTTVEEARAKIHRITTARRVSWEEVRKNQLR